MDKTTPIYRPYLCGREKDYVAECLESTWISSRGEFISRFENEFAQYIGARYASSVCNGTVALHLALETLGLEPGDEVIVPTLTYIASINTIIQAGARPVFADSLADTWQLDPDEVLNRITPRTRAVMAVHLYGLPCDMDRLAAICREYGLYLIEDCAEAFGTLYKGRHVGNFGDIAAFSFFGNKTITTGEGGMVVANDERLIDRARHLKNQAVSAEREYWHDTVAYNYRMTNICAAIGVAQLQQAPVILEKKRQIAAWYEDGLRDLPLEMHHEIPETRHSYWMCSLALDSADCRQGLRNHLRAAGIETRPVFPPAHTMPHCLSAEDFPVAESLGARGINLPSYPGLSEGEVGEICSAIRHFFA